MILLVNRSKDNMAKGYMISIWGGGGVLIRGNELCKSRGKILIREYGL